MSSLYPQHPYGRPVLGDPASLMARSPEEMRTFHRAHYQPQAMTVVIVGDVSWETTLELVSQSFHSFAPAVAWLRPPVPPQPPMTEMRRQELFLPRLEQARLMMAWVCPGVDQLRSAYGLDLLSALMAGGRTSRLVRELREDRQLVLDIGGSFSLQRESSLFVLTAWLDPEHLDQVEAVIGDRFSELASAPVSEVELARYKRLLCNDYAFSTETPSQIAGLYGYYAAIAEAELSVTYPHVIQSLQADELQQLAQQYLSPLRYGVTIMKPC